MSEVSITIGAESANRHFMACPAQTNPSTEASNPSAHDEDVHSSGRICTATDILQWSVKLVIDYHGPEHGSYSTYRGKGIVMSVSPSLGCQLSEPALSRHFPNSS